MFESSQGFAGFSVDDIEAAKEFYGNTLGLKVSDGGQPGVIELELAGGNHVMLYGKEDHRPATFTVLNFPVDDVGRAVDALNRKGVRTERFDEMGTADERGIYRGNGPTIAWFRDPAGNILSVLEPT